MIQNIKDYFASPFLEETEDLRINRILGIIFYTTIVMFPLGLIVITIANSSSNLLPVIALYLILIVSSWGLWRNGYIRPSAWLLISGFLIYLGWISYILHGGLHSPYYQFQALVVLLAGLIFGWRAGLIFSGFSIAIGVVYILNETNSSTNTDVFNPSNLEILLAQAIFLLTLSIIIFIITRSTQDAIQSTRQNEQKWRDEYEIAQHYFNQLEKIQAATFDLSQTLNLQQVLESLLIHLSQLINYDLGTVMLRTSDDHLEIQASMCKDIGLSSEPAGNIKFDLINVPLLQKIVLSKECLFIPHTEQDPIWLSSFDSKNIRTWVAVPMIARGIVVGVYSIGKSNSNMFSEEDMQYAESLAAQAAVAIQNAQLHEHIQQHAVDLEDSVAQRTTQLTKTLNRTQALYSVAHSLTSIQDLSELLQLIVARIAKAIPANRAILYILDVQNKKVLHCFFGGEGSHLSSEYTFNQLWEGATKWVVSERKPVFMLKNKQDSRESDSSWQRRQKGDVGSAIIVPLQYQDDILGTLMAINLPTEPDFSDEDLRLLEAMGQQTALAIESIRLLEREKSHSQEMAHRVDQRTEELKQANDRLLIMDKLKSKLIDDISHELRTPVTSIGLYLDLMEKGNEEKRAGYFNVIRTQTERLANLIEGIIAVTRLHKAESNFTVIAVHELLQQVVEGQQLKAESAKLTLTYSPDEQELFVFGNKIQLGTAVQNLIHNAIIYNNPNGFIKIYTSQVLDEVCLTITDTGMGIPETDLPHLFDHFYRGEQVGQLTIPGIGLGLTLTNEVVTIHNGRIEVSSQPNEGSTFKLYLPAIDSDHTPHDSTPNQMPK